MLLTCKRRRLERGLTLGQAADQLGLPASGLCRIESGREVPWPRLRARMVALYGLEDGRLFADVDAARAHLREVAGQEDAA